MWEINVKYTTAIFTGHPVYRDVYRIESIVSYRYHKTDTGIVSKWQINDTFNDTFYDGINKDSLTQKWIIFLIKCIFCFDFFIIWKIMVPEYYYTVCWVYQKAKRKKVEFFNGIVLSVSVLYRIVKK